MKTIQIVFSNEQDTLWIVLLSLIASLVLKNNRLPADLDNINVAYKDSLPFFRCVYPELKKLRKRRLKHLMRWHIVWTLKGAPCDGRQDHTPHAHNLMDSGHRQRNQQFTHCTPWAYNSHGLLQRSFDTNSAEVTPFLCYLIISLCWWHRPFKRKSQGFNSTRPSTDGWSIISLKWSLHTLIRLSTSCSSLCAKCVILIKP